MLKEDEDNNHEEEMTNSWNECKLDSQTLKFVKRERKEISFSWSVKSKRKHSAINNADDCSLLPLLEPYEIHVLHFLKGP